MKSPACLLVLDTLLLSSCATDSLVLPESPQPLLKALPTPDCYEGCWEVDPDTTAPGYFIPGAPYQYDGCTETDYDADFDGLDDYCEVALANLFRPALSFYQYDQVGQEPRYAAEKLPWGGVRIIYLLGYYYDVGNVTGFRSSCELIVSSPIWWLFGGAVEWIFNIDMETCRGHIGDSEWVAFDLRFDATSKHWVLDQAVLSAHDAPGTYTSGNGAYPAAFTYPDSPGGYPLIWVADGKHANYPTQSSCNSGGTLGSDNCWNGRTVERLSFPPGGSGNIGSWAVPFVDCVGTLNPNHPATLSTGGETRQECYFTGTSFRGWYGGTYSVSSTPYSTILAERLTGGAW